MVAEWSIESMQVIPSFEAREGMIIVAPRGSSIYLSPWRNFAQIAYFRFGLSLPLGRVVAFCIALTFCASLCIWQLIIDKLLLVLSVLSALLSPLDFRGSMLSELTN